MPVHAQVIAPGQVLCQAQVLHRPKPLPPATTYALLGGDQPQVLRQAALAGLWGMQLLRRGLAAFDRANSSGIEDTLLVRRLCVHEACEGCHACIPWLGHMCCPAACLIIWHASALLTCAFVLPCENDPSSAMGCEKHVWAHSFLL